MTDVMARVQKHYNRAVEHYGEKNVLGVFLYGSWNYGTNLPNSDVDTKCILLPDLFHLAIKPYEVKHLAVDDEVCECMTIMHMVANWKKQNINFVEVLFTDYCIINPHYKDLWLWWFDPEIKERIARYDMKAAVLSMAHQALYTMEQDPTDLKKLMNAARIADALARLTTYKDMSYKRVIWDEKVRGIRTGETILPDSFVEDMELGLRSMIESADKWAPDKDFNKSFDMLLNDMILDFIKCRIEWEN